MKHQETHPNLDVEDCFNCKVSGVRVGRIVSEQGRNATRVTKVIADDGPSAGTVVGKQRDHWDDRRDAKVFAPTVKIKSTVEEHR
jgi:2-keto-4-pentenoate hydratase